MSYSRQFRIFLNSSFLFLFCWFLFTYFTSLNISNSHFVSRPLASNDTYDGCSGLQESKDYKAKCLYLKSKDSCVSQGYINYLYLFYCILGRWPVLGYALSFLWLAVLFYVLGNTASVYFCSSLESLSSVLNLSPIVAGVTFLSLGNGAPDVFASIASFVGDGTADVGLNSVLGGTFFVSSVVVGVMCIAVSLRHTAVDRLSFIRDVCFFLVALLSLLVILILGKINLWGAIGFLSLYFVYVLVVCATHFCWWKDRNVDPLAIEPLLPISNGFLSCELKEPSPLEEPLLDLIDKEEPILMPRGAPENDEHRDATSNLNFKSSASYYFRWFIYLLEMPLYLPRRLTIPVVSEEGWSKPFAVISVTLAPILLAILWNSQTGDIGSIESFVIYICGGLVGSVFGMLAFFFTEKSSPPKRFLFLWLAGGFLMSVVWTYITAQELVALLVSLGNIIRISPSILGLTVLAWGNSIGDLIANVAMAVNGGRDGAQIAISGCYAGPIFNVLVGLGISLVFSSWKIYPAFYVLPVDSSLFETLGFLVAGLLWALIILPRRNMRLDKFLGGGLLAIYLCFLSIRLVQTLGSLHFL